jgi:hypothetical protein
LKKTIVFGFLFFITTILISSAQSPYIQHYTTFDGLPSNFVYQVYQDSQKFIWFATDAGVAKYDGSKFIYYRKQDGLSSNDVVKIKEDSQGRIWFFNMNATLNFFYKNKVYNNITTPFLDSLRPKEFFKDFYEDSVRTLFWYNNKDNEIYALDSLNHIKIYYLPSIPIYFKGDDIPNEGLVIRYLEKPEEKFLYLWTMVGLYKYNLLSGALINSGIEIKVNKVFPLATKYKYVQGVGINPDGASFGFLKKFDSYFHVDDSLKSINLSADFISNIILDANQNLWISTFDKGLFCLKDNNIIYHLDINRAQQIMQDNEGNLWIGSLKDGAYKLSPFVTKHYHINTTIFNNTGVLALSIRKKGGIWCTNSSKVYLVLNRKVLSTDLEISGSSFNQILQPNDDLLIVGEINLKHFALSGLRVSTLKNNISYTNIIRSPNPFKKIIINEATREVSSFEAYALSFINTKQPFKENNRIHLFKRIYNTFYNNSNLLVINADKNYVLENGLIIPYQPLSSFDNKVIYDHINLPDGNEVINLEGDSLFLFDGKNLNNLTACFDFPFDLQIRHLEYHTPTLIIGTTRNLYLCDHPEKVSLHQKLVIRPVDISFNNIHDIEYYNDSLYIASDDGLTVIPFESLKTISSYIPTPYINSIYIDDAIWNINDMNLILTGKRRLSITYSSINYSSNPVTYSYKMEGLDNDWHEAQGTQVVYQNLPKGDYKFMLRVRKATSGWSEEVKYPITIKATFWQQPVFFLILGLTLIIAGALIAIWRKNEALKKQQVEHQLILLEQKALQSMMNPHFIFNTLGSIQNYLLKNMPAEAGLFLSQFARLIRQNMNAINTAEINLEEEIDRLRNYLDLERMRLEGKFTYHIDIEGISDSEDILIPSMIIQPFVENAIWHGIAHLDYNGKIKVSFFRHDEFSLLVTIEDNGIGVKNAVKYSVRSEKHLGLGMDMTRKRLKLLGKKYHLETKIEISETNPGSNYPGTKVILIIPFTA